MHLSFTVFDKRTVAMSTAGGMLSVGKNIRKASYAMLANVCLDAPALTMYCIVYIIHVYTYIHIYIYIHICVCVCREEYIYVYQDRIYTTVLFSLVSM